jgi:hypothetical protein
VFFAILTAIALRSGSATDLERETLTPDFYELFLVLSFVLFIPTAYGVTVVCKLLDIKAVLKKANKAGASGHANLRRAYDLQRLGLADEEARVILERFFGGWQVRKKYAAFLSHYKSEAGTEAALMHGKLVEAMSGLSEEDVFLDSNNLQNLNDLVKDVIDSDVVILMLTKDVLSRPYCLLELYTAVDNAVPIIIVQIEGPHCGEPADIAGIIEALPIDLPIKNPDAEPTLARFSLDLKKISAKLATGLQADLDAPDKAGDEKAPAKHSKETLRAMFAIQSFQNESQTLVDDDDVGALDRAGIISLARSLGLQFDGEDYALEIPPKKGGFESVDINGDGMVDHTELLKVADKDGDGIINQDEFTEFVEGMAPPSGKWTLDALMELGDDGLVNYEIFSRWYDKLTSDGTSVLKGVFGKMHLKRQKKIPVFSFNSQVSKTLMQAKLSELLGSVVKVACPENRILHEMQAMEGSQLQMGLLDTDREKCIFVVYDQLMDEAFEQAQEIQTWLLDKSSLEVRQVVLISKQKLTKAKQSWKKMRFAMKWKHALSENAVHPIARIASDSSKGKVQDNTVTVTDFDESAPSSPSPPVAGLPSSRKGIEAAGPQECMSSKSSKYATAQAAKVDNTLDRIRNGEVSAVLFLQTARVLHRPGCVTHLYTALKCDVPVIPVALISNDPTKKSMAYRFFANKKLMNDFDAGLAPEVIGALENLCGAPAKTVGKVLGNVIPFAISKPFCMDATTSNAAERQVQLMEIAKTLLSVCTK